MHVNVHQFAREVFPDADSVVKSLDPLLELSLSHSASLSLTTIADCILICALTLGRQVSLGELSVTSKGSKFKIFTLCIVSRALDSREISILVDELCNILKKAFQLDAPSRHVERAVEVLQMLTLWQGQQRTKYIKANPTLNLCRTILNSAIGEKIKWNEKIKWKAARLVMQIGFRDRRSDLYYDSPTVCITFLEHHLTQEPQYRDYDSVADALRALSSIHPMPINAFSEGNVVRGICCSLRNEGPTGLTEMVLLLVYRGRHALWETATQSLLIEHSFSAALKKAWDCLVLANNHDAVYTRKYLDILAYMSDSSIWHPYIFGDHWDGFEHAAPLDRVWVIPLLEGEYARKTFGLKAAVECIRVAWKTGLYLEHVELPGLIYRTINLLVLRGQPAVSELDEEINNALHAVGAEERNTDVYPVDVQLRLAVLKEIVGFVKDVKTDMPDGWERCVVTKAKVRRRKFVARFRRRSSGIECGKRCD